MHVNSDITYRQNAASFWWSLALLGAISAYCNDAILPILPMLEDAFSVSPAQAQYLFTAGLFGYAAAQIPIGFLSDRYGRRPVGIVVGFLLVLATLSALLAQTYTALLASRVCLGAAIAYSPVLSRAIIRDITAHASKLAGGYSILHITLAAGTIFAPIVTNYLTPALGWRAGFLNCLVVVFGVWVLFAIFIPETKIKDEARLDWGQRFIRSLGLFFRNRDTLAGTSFFTLYFVGYFAILTTMASILVDEFGRSPHQFGWAFASVAISNVIGAALCRRLSHTVGNVTIISYAVLVALCTGLGAFLMLKLPLGFGFILFLAVLSLWAFGMGLVIPAASALALHPLGAVAGAGSSIIGTVQIFCSALASALVATLYTGTKSALLWFLIVVAILLCASFLIYKKSNIIQL